MLLQLIVLPKVLQFVLVKTAAEHVAKEDHRTLTSLIEKLLTDHLRELGRLSSSKPGSKRK